MAFQTSGGLDNALKLLKRLDLR
uniref:Uncharacterized protein n=1 Tax=Rhizophora mucronata TaxID=61149 RepID=A0A2P2LHN3_RHIMU